MGLAAEPADLSTWNTVPGATVATALVPLPTNRSKAVNWLAPVPPLATESCPWKPKVKVLLAIVPVTLVSLATNPTKLVPKVEELVPPLATGRIPVTSAVRETLAQLAMYAAESERMNWLVQVCVVAATVLLFASATKTAEVIGV